MPLLLHLPFSCTAATCNKKQLANCCRLIDFVATLSMLLDIPTIVNGLNSISNSSSTIGADEVSYLARGTSNTSANKVRQITRVCRILRLMRLVYLYNQYELHKQASFCCRFTFAHLHPSRLSAKTAYRHALHQLSDSLLRGFVTFCYLATYLSCIVSCMIAETLERHDQACMHALKLS